MLKMNAEQEKMKISMWHDNGSNDISADSNDIKGSIFKTNMILQTVMCTAKQMASQRTLVMSWIPMIMSKMEIPPQRCLN
jgi:hypothetical protein